MEQVYHKLVRDRIPEVIRKNGQIPVTRALNPAEYRTALEQKLLEECGEALAAAGGSRVEELADILEVIRALAGLEGASLEEVMTAAQQKAQKRGTFSERILLEKVIVPDAAGSGNEGRPLLK